MMLWFTAAAIVAASPAPPAQTPVVVTATATVRIVSGVRLKLDSTKNAGAPTAHRTSVAADGIRRPAQLIEFE
jgi:hypothetical protein